MEDSLWMRTIGRVAFLNCDPLFFGIDQHWEVLAAPPAWLTGHLLRKDCILAPIPAADYARHSDELILLPDIGICSRGEVGSVLVFGEKPLEQMASIALPTDSATSVQLLKFLLEKRGLEPRFELMGPDLDSMLAKCEGALLNGDIAGVFAARKDTPIESLRQAQGALIDNLRLFEQKTEQREKVIEWAMSHSELDYQRLDRYFGEVFNRIDKEHLDGLNEFLVDACGLEGGAQFAW